MTHPQRDEFEQELDDLCESYFDDGLPRVEILLALKEKERSMRTSN